MERIGRYRIIDKLGQGGMGVVYKAFDPQIERTVAIKVISGQLLDNPDLRDRFFREARAGGQLTHKNIIVVYDLGEEEGQPYIAMEFVDGTTLDALLRSPESLSIPRRLAVAVEICEGLAYAHDHGVIHRDVKPGNIMVTRQGHVKILDFGLARLVSSDLTKSNLMLGTMNYMAPEQLRGDSIDHRVDIFAVGVVMYEMLTGRRPFEGDSLASAIYKVLQEEPPPVDQCNPSIPAQLGPVVTRALAKDRDQRYQTMPDLARDIAAVQVAMGDRLASSTAPAIGAHGSALELEPTVLRDGSSLGPRPRTPAPLGTPAPTRATPATGQRPPSTDLAPTIAVTKPRRRLSPALIAAAIVVVAVLVVAMNLPLRRSQQERPSQTAASSTTPTSSADTAKVLEHVNRGREALKIGDFETAAREGRAAIALAPADGQAQKLNEDVRQVRSKIESDLREAKRLLNAGRFNAAARAAGAVLAVAPANEDARALMQQLSTHTSRQSADEASQQVSRARAQAEAAGARELASEPYRAGQRAEADARRRYAAGDFAQATTRFYESSGIYHSAEGEARRAFARAEETRRAREREDLDRRIAAARETYDRRKAEAEAAGAPQRAGVTYTAALQAAASAQQRNDAGSVRGYEQAAAEMSHARQVALDAAAKERLAQNTQPSPQPLPAPPAAVAPAQPAPPPAQPVETPAEEVIRVVLQRYVAALESRDVVALRRIWPSLPQSQERAIQEDFENARDINVAIDAVRIDAAGESATVSCLRRYQVQTRDGHRLDTETRTTLGMRKTGPSSWVIQSIRHEKP